MAVTKKEQGIPLIGPVLTYFFGSRNQRFVKRYTARVDAINALEPEIRKLTDAQLRAKTAAFHERVEKGERAESMLIEVFAVAREAMDRAVGIRNIFNPEHAAAFDPSRLPDSVRSLYEQTKAEMESREPAPPEGEFLGCEQPQPGWMQVDIPNEIYEAVREIYPQSRPPFRARPFNEQLIGAMVLSQGKISEMKTGEGKTIVAPLACYLASLEGLKCHVVTVNDYLVQRDRDWTYPFFHAVGLTVGAIHPQHVQPEDVKRQMYKCDVVYGTTAEFGFDYLRDNMKRQAAQQVQRVREFAIVDEVDSILIDEARTPLIISGLAYDDQPRYDLADRLAKHLVEKQKPWADADEKINRCKMRIKGLEGDIRNARDKSAVPAIQKQLEEARAQLPKLEQDRDRHTQYYEVEMDKKRASLTHQGVDEAQRQAGVGSFYVGANVDIPHLMEQSIRAYVVYQRDRDYVVMPLPNPQTGQQEPSVVIVDTFTGRPMVGRQWSDGLHQAVEVKEGVPVKQETQTVASITIQNFFKMYKRLAGMTGTADTEAQEFHDIYRLDVVSIPTNVPVVRRDFDDIVYLAGKDKWDAIVDEIKGLHDVGRPVLVGTTSVERSEQLSDMLTKKHGVKHEVLNAKQHEREANMIEDAGQLGAVMIATNMAGRGTDIKLGRVPRAQLLEHWQRRGIAPRELTVDATDEQVRELVYRKIASKELGRPKREVEEMDFAEVELELLRKWASEHTWLDEAKIQRLDADQLRTELDEHGRFLLHRIGWVENVEQLGGLHVIGTERHESRRIDNQLRGRSGRQGDRGSSRFFVSLDDDLMKMFAGETTMKILSRLGMKEGDAIEHPMLSKSVERAQRKVEERNFHIRKNILEYDEVMEHQRQTFYGLRQRVIEAHNIRGLIFEYIEESVIDAVERFLDPDYPAECAAEAARQELGVSVPAERLRGRSGDDIIPRVVHVAKDEARSMINVTLGEYMPADGMPEDYDLTGLSNWALSDFGVELKPHEIREMTPHEVELMLVRAAEDRIEDAELSNLERFVEPGYGVAELRRWTNSKFGVEITEEQLAPFLREKQYDEIVGLITREADARYREREIEHPVTFAMQMTMNVMRQAPKEAGAQLVRWANIRYGLEWDESVLRTRMPQQLQEELLRESRRFVEEGRLEKAVEEALALPDDEAVNKHLLDRYGFELRDYERGKEGEEREKAIRARIEGILRSEMIQFEQFVLLEVLDSVWKDHLRAMDQTRDSIGFRAFSQQDPRIAYKREGARHFEEAQQTIRDRVTEYIFKMRLSPQMGQPQGPPPGQRRQPQAPAPDAPPQGSAAPGQSAGIGGGMIAGPGFDAPTGPDRSPAPAQDGAGEVVDPESVAMSGRARRDIEEAGKAGATPDNNAGQPAAKGEQRMGRNDPCPRGTGLKYKKCCNRHDGVCTGAGLDNAAATGDANKQE